MSEQRSAAEPRSVGTLTEVTLTWVDVCGVDEVAEGTAKAYDIGGTPVALVRSAGIFYAIYDVCSHADIALSEGEVDGTCIECWLHGSRFSLETGHPTGPPANRPVPVYPVKVDGERVLVAMETTPAVATAEQEN